MTRAFVTAKRTGVQFVQSPKVKRVSLNETPEFPFRGLNICVDFNLRDSKKGEYEKTKNNLSKQKY